MLNPYNGYVTEKIPASFYIFIVAYSIIITVYIANLASNKRFSERHQVQNSTFIVWLNTTQRVIYNFHMHYLAIYFLLNQS